LIVYSKGCVNYPLKVIFCVAFDNQRPPTTMFDEENEMKDAEEYRGKMERLAADCKEGNVGAISCHHAAEFFTMVDVSKAYSAASYPPSDHSYLLCYYSLLYVFVVL
jgi:hypothetical protein